MKRFLLNKNGKMFYLVLLALLFSPAKSENHVKDLKNATVSFMYNSDTTCQSDASSKCLNVPCGFGANCIQCNLRKERSEFTFTGLGPFVILYTSKTQSGKIRDGVFPPGAWTVKVDRMNFKSANQSLTSHSISPSAFAVNETTVILEIVLQNDYYFD